MRIRVTHSFLSLLLLSFALTMTGCQLDLSDMFGEKVEDIRCVEYRYKDITITRIDDVPKQRTFFYDAEYDSITLEAPDAVIDWSLSHEMSGSLFFCSDNSIALGIQLGLDTVFNGPGLFRTLDYADYWDLEYSEHSDSIRCIYSNNCEPTLSLISYETDNSHQYFPYSQVSARVIVIGNSSVSRILKKLRRNWIF